MTFPEIPTFSWCCWSFALGAFIGRAGLAIGQKIKRRKGRAILATIALLFLFAVPADASWHTHWVRENYNVTVHPSPVWTSSGWNVPSPYSERRTRWVQQRVWVDDPIIYRTAPIYVSPPIYCTPIYYATPIYYSTPIYNSCPVHSPSPSIIYPGW